MSIFIKIYLFIYVDDRWGDNFVTAWREAGYFIVGLFYYICSSLLFVWLFFFTYALLTVVYVSYVEDRFFNTPRL
jgi:hypothetical protein